MVRLYSKLCWAHLFAFIAYLVYRHVRVITPSFTAVMFVLLVAGSLALILGNAGKIETLKVSSQGIEAKTRELEGVITEAKATVASLHTLAKTMAAFQVERLAAEGRWGGSGTTQVKDRQKDCLLADLKAQGLSESELEEVEKADRPWVLFDYMIAILAPLNTANDKEKSAAYATAFEADTPLNPDECAALLKRFNIDLPKINDLLEDYRYYFATGKQRRPDVWRNRGNW